ncbi:MAG: adenylate/guanylate cyclase domain-containing protein [Paracoccaceae bacterium]
MASKPSAAAASIVHWMVDAALETTPIEHTFTRLVLALRDEGIEIDRAYLAHPTLHPLHRGSSFLWTLEAGLSREFFAIDGASPTAAWKDSPIRHAITHNVDRLRRRLAGPGAMCDFPVLKDFAAAGLTDYLLVAVPFDGFRSSMPDMGATIGMLNGSGMACTFATARPGGFSDDEIETLDWLKRPLAVVVKMADQRRVAEALAECYIGKEAGPRVLRGAIRRGDFASTEAVVWLSDLRASTQMSMTLPREAFIATINDFFDCTVGAVEAEGGEPLSFIGDGALAIFPVEAMGAGGARDAALRAAARAQAAMADLNANRAGAGREPLNWGLALHAGVLDYGNIGSLTRHTWSVLGPVVNETARLEGVTKLTGEPVVASRAFAAGLARAAEWRSIGSFDLKGMSEPFEVFAPPTEACLKEDAA